MSSAETVEEFNQLNADEAVINILVAAGFVNKVVSKSNRDAAYEKALIHFALITRKLEMDDIRRGMEMISLASFLQKNRCLWESQHVFPRVNDIAVSGDILSKKLTLHASAEDLDEDQNKTFEWCKQYVTCLPGT